MHTVTIIALDGSTYSLEASDVSYFTDGSYNTTCTALRDLRPESNPLESLPAIGTEFISLSVDGYVMPGINMFSNFQMMFSQSSVDRISYMFNKKFDLPTIPDAEGDNIIDAN